MKALGICIGLNLIAAFGWSNLQPVDVDKWSVSTAESTTTKSSELSSKHEERIAGISFVLDNPSYRDITVSVTAIDQNDEPWDLIKAKSIKSGSLETVTVDVAKLSGKAGYGMRGLKALRIEGERKGRPEFVLIYDIGISHPKLELNDSGAALASAKKVVQANYAPRITAGQVWHVSFNLDRAVTDPFGDHGVYARVLVPGGKVSLIPAKLTRRTPDNSLRESYRWRVSLVGEKPGQYSLRLFHRDQRLDLPGGAGFLHFACKI